MMFISSHNYSKDKNYQTFNLILNERKRLFKEAKNLNGFKKNLYIFSAETILSKDNQHNWNHGNELYWIIKNSNPKNILTTYEGHSWERLFYYYSRKAIKIKMFGISTHSIIQKNHSI